MLQQMAIISTLSGGNGERQRDGEGENKIMGMFSGCMYTESKVQAEFN